MSEAMELKLFRTGSVYKPMTPIKPMNIAVQVEEACKAIGSPTSGKALERLYKRLAPEMLHGAGNAAAFQIVYLSTLKGGSRLPSRYFGPSGNHVAELTEILEEEFQKQVLAIGVLTFAELVFWQVREQKRALIFELEMKSSSKEPVAQDYNLEVFDKQLTRNMRGRSDVVHVRLPTGYSGKSFKLSGLLGRSLLDWSRAQGLKPKTVKQFFYDTYLKTMACTFGKYHDFVTVLPLFIGVHPRPLSLGAIIVHSNRSLIPLDSRGRPDPKRVASMMQLGVEALGPVRLTEEVILRNDMAERVAVSAVMARNMSHNIGSHVLAELGQRRESSKWYTSRYLQQRMDFLARVATERPTGTASCWLLQDLVRWFLTQDEVLDSIAASEKFRAYRFEKLAGPAEGRAAIQLHVLSVPSKRWDPRGQKSKTVDERVQQLKEYCHELTKSGKGGCGRSHDPSLEECDCARVLLLSRGDGVICEENDLQVAIPGGVVGQQALFVILENVIRNAAKHSAALSSKSSNLEIVIEVLEDSKSHHGIETPSGKRPAALVRIYDNLSRLQNGLRLWGTDSGTKAGINDMLNEDLVDESGALRRGHWGLDEMRIAAQFLQMKEIVEREDGLEAVTGSREVHFSRTSKSAKGSSHVIRAVRSPLNTLGYELFLLRPREIVIVSDSFGGGSDVSHHVPGKLPHRMGRTT